VRSKIKAKKRQIQLLATRTHVEIEQDYRWWRHTDVEPACGYVEETYSWKVPVHQKVELPRTRRQPPVFLSRRKMRNRLSAAGLRGEQLRQFTDDIKAGPAKNVASSVHGQYVLDWPVAILKQYLGRRMYRSLTRFIAKLWVVYDEFGAYANPGLADFFHQCRSIGFTPILVQQQAGQLVDAGA
jgi:hypothetical protein